MSQHRMIVQARAARASAGTQCLGVDVRMADYVCEGCRRRVSLSVREPLPPGWRTRPARYNAVVYWCAECAAPGGLLDSSGIKAVRP